MVGPTGERLGVQHAPTDDDARRGFLTSLLRRLGDAVGPDELLAATASDVPGVTRRLDTASVWIGDRVLVSTLPRVVLELDPPVDACWLSDAWSIAQPVAVSGDVHQAQWHLLVAGAELPDPHGKRIAASSPSVGPWGIDLLLTGRPDGPLPDVSAGASPAYDVRTTGGAVSSIAVSRAWRATTTAVVGTDHPDVERLGLRVPPPRPRRWCRRPDVAAEVAVVAEFGQPLAGAAFRVDRGVLSAGPFAVAASAGPRHAGSALLDALEALALANEAEVVRCDDTVLGLHQVVPFERYGYRLRRASGRGRDTTGVERRVRAEVVTPPRG